MTGKWQWKTTEELLISISKDIKSIDEQITQLYDDFSVSFFFIKKYFFYKKKNRHSIIKYDIYVIKLKMFKTHVPPQKKKVFVRQ